MDHFYPDEECVPCISIPEVFQVIAEVAIKDVAAIEYAIPALQCVSNFRLYAANCWILEYVDLEEPMQWSDYLIHNQHYNPVVRPFDYDQILSIWNPENCCNSEY